MVAEEVREVRSRPGRKIKGRSILKVDRPSQPDEYGFKAFTPFTKFGSYRILFLMYGIALLLITLSHTLL